MNETAAHPPRYRWLKRLTIAFAVYFALLIGLRVFWGHRWHSRFEAQLQAIRDRGEPIDLEDFQPPPLDDADNAATYLYAARNAWPNVPGESVTIVEHNWYERSSEDLSPGQPNEYGTGDPITDHEGYLALCQPALDELDRALAAPGCDWRFQLQRPVFQSVMPHLGDSRIVAKLIKDAVRRAAALGDKARAVDLLQRLQALTKLLRDRPIFVIDHLVDISIGAMVCMEVERLLPQLEHGDASDELRQRLTELMNTLADEQAIHSSQREALLMERFSLREMCEIAADGSLPGNSSTLAAMLSPRSLARIVYSKPLIYRDGVSVLEYYDTLIGTAHVGRYADVAGLIAGVDSAVEGWYPLFHPIKDWLYMPTSTFTTHAKYLAERRMTRVAIALKLYEWDRGQPAGSLEALVPQYLETIPQDPFSAEGHPLRYVAAGVTPKLPRYHVLSVSDQQRMAQMKIPILYSIGIDGVDDRGLLLADEHGGVRLGTQIYDDFVSYDQCFLLVAPVSPVPQDEQIESEPFGFGSFGP